MTSRPALVIRSLAHFSCVSLLLAGSPPSGFTETVIAGSLNSPTAMKFAPDGRIFFCQQDGQVRVIKNGVLLPAPFLSVATDLSGERGLLGIAFHPDFIINNYVYIYYTV